MSDRKQDVSFKVIDRRLFTADGQLRNDVVEQQQREQAAPAAAPAPAADAPKPSLGFKVLISFLARNAELVLAGLPDPRTGEVVLDIESLRQIVEMLDALREKTRGNLAQEEDQTLQELIGDLKYTYLQVSQNAVPAARGPAKPHARKP